MAGFREDEPRNEKGRWTYGGIKAAAAKLVGLETVTVKAGAPRSHHKGGRSGNPVGRPRKTFGHPSIDNAIKSHVLKGGAGLAAAGGLVAANALVKNLGVDHTFKASGPQKVNGKKVGYGDPYGYTSPGDPYDLAGGGGGGEGHVNTKIGVPTKLPNSLTYVNDRTFKFQIGVVKKQKVPRPRNQY